MKNTSLDSLHHSAPDRLVDHRRVNELLGLKCKTSHTARAYADRGLIRAVRINARVVRFSESSIFALLGGNERGAA
jgi:hypothetical protein